MKDRTQSNRAPGYLSLLLAHLLCLPGVSIAENLVQNGGFEDGSYPIVEWTSSGVGLFAGWEGAAEGNNFACVGVYIYQDLPTTAGQQYELRFAMAGNVNVTALTTMDTLWGGQVVAVTSWNPAGHDINHLGWIYSDLIVVATDSLTRLEFLNPGQFDLGPFLDAVSVTPVPEVPGSTLVVFFLGAIVVYQKRLRSANAKSVRAGCG